MAVRSGDEETVAEHCREEGIAVTDQVGETVLRPTPGEGLLARVGDLVLLYDPEPEETAQQLLQTLENSGRAGGDGRILIRDLARLVHSMAEPPAFVAYGPTDGGHALLVHGSAVVAVTAGGEELRYDGAQAITWIDRILHGVSSVAAALGNALPSVVSTKVRLDNGVVPAGGFSMVHADVGPVPAGQGPGVVPVPDPLAVGVGGPVSVIDEAISDPGAVDTPGTPGYASAVEEIYADSAPLAAVDADAPAAEPMPPAAPAPFGEPAVPQPEPFAAVPPFPEPGAPPMPDPGPPPQQEPFGGGPGAPPFGEPAAPPFPEPGAPPPQDPYGGPGAPPPFPPEPGAPPMPDPGPPQDPYGGVPGEPGNDFGVLPGTEQPQEPYGDPQQGMQPAVGVLVLDDGQTFTLDQNYVIGREPEPSQEVLSGQAAPVRIQDPDALVSRAHAMVSLSGWDVQVIDLGSANGTFVFPPGSVEWVQVPPQQPAVITPGTHIAVGGRTFSYESHGAFEAQPAAY